jgi:hypothetical protein
MSQPHKKYPVEGYPYPWSNFPARDRVWAFNSAIKLWLD